MFCECGCGLTVTRGRQFRRGHAAAMAAKLRKQLKHPDPTIRRLALRTLNRRGWASEINLGNKFGVELEFFGMEPGEAAEAIRQAGVPAEAEDYNHENRAYWKIVDDSSVNGEGNELVSPILRLPTMDSRTQVNRAADALRSNGGRIDTTCGYHVHHDASKLDPMGLYRTVLSYGMWQPQIDRMLPYSRHGSQSYCGPMDIGRIIHWPKRWLVEGRPRNLREIAEDGRRYENVNLQSLLDHGTLEFRQHSGTLNKTKVWNWARFTKLFLEVKKDPANLIQKYGSLESFQTEATFEDMLSFLKVPSDLADWCQLRRNQLDRGTDEEDIQSESRESYERSDYDDDSYYEEQDHYPEDEPEIYSPGSVWCRRNPPAPGAICGYCNTICVPIPTTRVRTATSTCSNVTCTECWEEG